MTADMFCRESELCALWSMALSDQYNGTNFLENYEEFDGKKALELLPDKEINYKHPILEKYR